MDAILTGLIGAGPFGILAAVLFWFLNRALNRNDTLTDKLADISTATVAALKDNTTAINAALAARKS